jgi:hypothetical protein
MNLLDHLERQIERLIEGSFTRWAGQGIHPLEIGRQLLRALDREAVADARGLVLPNVYRVSLHPEDFAQCHEVEATLIDEGLAAVHARAGVLRGRFEGPLRIELIADAEIAPGALFVVATIVAGDGPSQSRPHARPDIRPRLRVLADPLGDATREFALAGSVTTIGRGADQAIALRDLGVSRTHARIECGSEGVTIVDLGSRNGTVVNGRCLKAARAPLREGDRIRIGRVIFEYLTER